MSNKSANGRISVNVTPATMTALHLVAESENVTITEALRRLVGYGDLVYRTVRNDHKVLLDSGGRLEQVVLL